MTTTSPLPAPAHAPYPAGAGWAPVPTPAVVQQAVSAPAVPRPRRLEPAQVWTLVVAGLVAVVALVVGLAVTSSGGSDGDAADLFDDSGYYYDYSGYDDSCFYGC
ncbi:hypothetical protein [Blastococcus sp. SYSU D00813]